MTKTWPVEQPHYKAEGVSLYGLKATHLTGWGDVTFIDVFFNKYYTLIAHEKVCTRQQLKKCDY